MAEEMEIEIPEFDGKDYKLEKTCNFIFEI